MLFWNVLWSTVLILICTPVAAVAAAASDAKAVLTPGSE